MTNLPLPAVVLAQSDYEALRAKAALWDAHGRDLRGYAIQYVDGIIARSEASHIDGPVKQVLAGLRVAAEYADRG